MQDRDDVPEFPDTVADERVHERLVELVVNERETVPANPLRDDSEIVELPDDPTLTGKMEGFAAIVKSWT